MSEYYELKQCAHCGAFIPVEASMCAQCGTSDVDGARAPRQAPRQPRRAAPAAALTLTTVVLAANVAYFLWSLFVQAQHTPNANPLRTLIFWTFSTPREAAGLADSGWYRHVLVFEYGQYWRLLAATFLHGGLLHIGVNMWVWWQIGRFAEELWGAARLLVVYVVSALGSTLAITIWYAVIWGEADPVPMVGASGAIFGVLGALTTFAWRLGTQRGRRFGMMLFRNILFMLALGFLIPFVSNVGHVGGLLPGMALGAVVGERFGDRLRPADGRWNAIGAICVAACVLALVQGFLYSLGRMAG